MMFVEIDHLVDISSSPFSDLYRPFIYMNELQQHNAYLFELSISEYATQRFYNSSLLNRKVLTFSLFSNLIFKHENKGPYSSRLLYKI